MIGLLNVILGAGLLVAGRKLFWLLVGTIGFLVGIELATRLFHRSELVTVVAGLALGVAFALLAIFVESVAIGLAGFLGGGYVLRGLAALVGLHQGAGPVIAFVAGGILGVILVVLLFDWALITISSLAGASMIVGGLGLLTGFGTLTYLGLMLFGVIFQGMALRRRGSTRDERSN